MKILEYRSDGILEQWVIQLESVFITSLFRHSMIPLFRFRMG